MLVVFPSLTSGSDIVVFSPRLFAVKKSVGDASFFLRGTMTLPFSPPSLPFASGSWIGRRPI